MIDFEDATSPRGVYFGEGVGPYHLSDVVCNGNEKTLLECSYSQSIEENEWCILGNHNRGAGVICDSKYFSSSWSIYRAG